MFPILDNLIVIKKRAETVFVFNKNITHHIVMLITSKISVESTMFPHHNIHKFTLTSPHGKTHNEIGQILIDSCVFDVPSFTATDCDNDHHLAVAKKLGSG
jgi:hypothetical protein